MGIQDKEKTKLKPRAVPAKMIPKRNEITVSQVVELLNQALRIDEIAITNLIRTRVPCNKALAKHQTIQVGLQPGCDPDGSDEYHEYEVGLLGLINGLFGIDEKQWGAIAAEMDKAGHICNFVVREPWSGVFTERIDA